MKPTKPKLASDEALDLVACEVSRTLPKVMLKFDMKKKIQI